MNLRRELVLTIGYVFMLAWSWVAIYTFMKAYLNPPHYYTVVFVNLYGEAAHEFVLIVLVAPIIVFTSTAFIQDVVIRPWARRVWMHKSGIEVIE